MLLKTDLHSRAMLKAVLLVTVLICGCSPATHNDPFTQEVTDKQGTNRLVLNYTPVGLALFGSRRYEFKSLVWQTKTSSNWGDKIIISKAAFQGTGPKERWISRIDSFDPASGIATIRVAEADSPINSKNILYVYSWREWSLLTNGEIQLLRICTNPFEQFQEK